MRPRLRPPGPSPGSSSPELCESERIVACQLGEGRSHQSHAPVLLVGHVDLGQQRLEPRLVVPEGVSQVSQRRQIGLLGVSMAQGTVDQVSGGEPPNSSFGLAAVSAARLPALPVALSPNL